MSTSLTPADPQQSTITDPNTRTVTDGLPGDPGGPPLIINAPPPPPGGTGPGTGIVKPGPSQRTAAKAAPAQLFVNPAQDSIPIVYGRTKIGGGIIYANLVGAVLYLVVAICEGEIEQVESIYFDDKTLPLKGVTSNSYTGTLTQALDGIISGVDSNWNQTFPALAYATFAIDQGVSGINGIPNISFVVKGRHVRDPRLDASLTTRYYSENPVLHTADLMTDPNFGGRITDAEMNWSGSITTSANACDTNIAPVAPVAGLTAATGSTGSIPAGTYKYKFTYVDFLGNETAPSPSTTYVAPGSKNVSLSSITAGPAGTHTIQIYRTKVGGSTYFFLHQLGNGTTTYTDNTLDIFLSPVTVPSSGTVVSQFRFGGALLTTNQLSQWLDTLRSYYQGSIVFNGSTWDIIADKPWVGGNVHDFTSDEIGTDLVVSVAEMKDNPTRVTVSYIDTLNSFKDASITQELQTTISGSTAVREAKYQLVGCPTGDQATRHAVYFLNSRLADQSVSFSCNQQGLQLLPGDVISLTHPIGFSATQFRVTEASLDESLSKWLIKANEYSAAAYSTSIVEVDSGTVNSLPDPYAPPPAPTSVTVEEQIITGGNGLPASAILVSWTNGVTPLYAGTQITVNDGTNNIVLPVTFASPQQILNPTIGQLYTITLQTVNSSDVLSSPVQIQITPIFSGSFVPDVTGLTTPSTTNAVLGQTWWTNPNYPYLDHFVVYDTFGNPANPPIVATVPVSSSPTSTDPLILPQAVHGDGYATPMVLSLTVYGVNTLGNFSAGVSGGWTVPASGLGSYNVNFDPRDVEIGGGYIWVSCFGSDTVQRINPADGSVANTISIPHTTGSVSQPFQTVWDGTNVWVTPYSQSHLVKIDGTALTTSNILDPTIVNPVGICYDGTSVWTVGNGSSGKAWKINPTANTLTATVTVGNQPAFCSSFNGFIYVSNFNSNTVSVINASAATVQATIQVGNGPIGLCNDGTYVWCANYRDATVMKIDPVSQTVIATVSLQAGAGPVDVVYDDNYIWVTSGALAQISRINPSTNTITATAALPSFPRTVVWDGSNLWIANNTNATTGFVNITVSSPSPGGGTSNPAVFTIAGSDFNPLPFVV